MSLRNRFVLMVVVAAVAGLAGCSSTHSPVPPPSGGFSNTNFNGTYTFSVSGANGNGLFTMAGSLVACGCSAGTISSGTVDLADPTGAAPASTIGSNSQYSITKDGRGFARLMITTPANLATEVDVDFVLTSSSHGLIIRFDGNGTGSGTIDLQPGAVTLGTTPYSFTLSGGDLTNAPLATVGAFTLNSSGTITTGVEDFNYKAAPSTQLPLTGSVQVGSGTTPGVATLSTTFGILGFDVYAIDATHLKLIESDGLALLVGDVFTQSSATIPAGNLVFTMSDLDSNGDLVAIGGLMSSDGNSQIPSGSEDVNDAGTVDGGVVPAVPNSFSGSFAPTGGGRLLVSLVNFAGGANFAAYPSSGGLLMLEVDSGLNAGVTSGVALAQAATPSITASEGYGLNMTGEDVTNGGELDAIAQFQTTSSAFTNGLLDLNDGGPDNPQNFGGSYTAASNGSGSATLISGLASMFFYVADGSTVLFISTDPTQAAQGLFEMQTTPTAAIAGAAQARPLPMLRFIPHTHTALRKSKPTIGFKK